MGCSGMLNFMDRDPHILPTRSALAPKNRMYVLQHAPPIQPLVGYIFNEVELVRPCCLTPHPASVWPALFRRQAPKPIHKLARRP